MAKLYFRYGAMNSGKSTALLQVAYNYEERGQRVLLAKPAVDTKGDAQIISRLGVAREVDFLITPQDDVRELFARHARGYDPDALVATVDNLPPVAALLVDEAQFLTGEQVEDLQRIATLDGVPVLTYGLRTDFQTHIFPGSQRLLALANTLEELKTICRCGKKAILNGRQVDGRFIFAGDQISIDGAGVSYESLCASCYLEESGGSFG
ncbi:thymidine kinase [Actinomyces minihominis]|uniref:thymidine kinase n=1 Tax=Actinomyces minihominis TaxID=2002838 RepID=UPI000C07CDD0|nr:thymidine kinase [Actinomyces minihominis]